MSSYYDDASLMLLASGGAQKDGKVYSVKPTDGSGDFTFTRGSNLAATRVDAAYLIEKGRENLLLQSETFNNAVWIKGNSSVTANSTTAPNGTNTADKIIENTANNTHYAAQGVTASNEVYTYSVYVKPDTTTRVRVQMSDLTTGDVRLEYDFTTETKAHNTSGSRGSWSSIGYSITNISNGWVRFSLSAKKGAGSSASCSIFLLDASGNSSYTGDGTSGLFVWGAQLETSLVATDYIPTTTTTGTAGILEDTPRFDYSFGASCPSLLLEPSRTNLMVNSEGFSTSDWTDNKTNTNVTANAAVSPEGVQNATEIEFTTTGGAEIYDQFVNVASSMNIGTIFLKNNNVNKVEFELTGGVPEIAAEVTIDLRDGTLSFPTGSYTPTIEDYGNGWWRVAIGDTSNASVATPAFKLKSVGSNIGSFYAYGAQVEAATYPTSYIPTYGTSVTRAAELCLINNMALNTALGATAGTLMIEFDYTQQTLGDVIQWYSSANNIGRGYLYARSIGFADTWGTSGLFTTDGVNTKVIWRLNSLSSGSFFKDGVKGNDADGSAQPWNNINNLWLRGAFGTMRVKQILFMPTALSDLDCEILTGATTYNTFAEMAVALNYTVYE